MKHLVHRVAFIKILNKDSGYDTKWHPQKSSRQVT